MQFLSQLPERRGAWALLFASAVGLVLAALYMQYQMGLDPCVKCIYQRVAVMGIAAAALPALFAPRLLVARLLSYTAWLTAAIWGLRIAHDHVVTQQSANAYFAVCDAFPVFPDWLPLLDWFPSLFEAPGLCGDISWVFLDMSMPEWMRIIFAFYTGLALVVIAARLLGARKL